MSEVLRNKDGGKYVLAMYDIRAKQEFIFKCNRIKEIAGGSFLIRDIYDDYLYEAANGVHDKKGIYHEETEFSKAGFEKHLKDYVGEVVYHGGGNFLLLFESEAAFKEVTYRFTKKILKEVGTLRVLGTCVEVSNELNSYQEDRDRLYAKHRMNENQESNITPYATLPIVKVDRRTSLPLSDYNEIIKENVSKESAAKYNKYHKESNENEEVCKKCSSECKQYKVGETILDNLVEEKGKNSLLAVIYIDGNNMGAQVENLLDNNSIDDKYQITDAVSEDVKPEEKENLKSYYNCVKRLRAFSKYIEKNYITDRVANIDKAINQITDKSEVVEGCPFKKKIKDENVGETKEVFIERRRLVVAAGDEINIICKASDALECAKTYLENLPEGCSACAGIAIFHSHAPYADVYRIAEECCETGKQLMKKYEEKDDNGKIKALEASFIDFHYCRGAIGLSLEEMRKIDDEIDITRPWLVKVKEEPNDCNLTEKLSKITRLKDVEEMRNALNIFARRNVKGLLSAAKEGEVALKLEIKRMIAHLSSKKKETYKDQIQYLEAFEKKDAEGNTKEAKRRKLIYDIVSVYDLWFGDKTNNTEENTEK